MVQQSFCADDRIESLFKRKKKPYLQNEVYGFWGEKSTKNDIRRDEGAVEDEGGDVDEPFPGFELLPPDTERQINRHRNGGPAHQENKESEEFLGEHRKSFSKFGQCSRSFPWCQFEIFWNYTKNPR